MTARKPPGPARYCVDCDTQLTPRTRVDRCRRCYEHHRYFVRRKPAPKEAAMSRTQPTKPCPRCGIKIMRVSAMCRDCRDVLGDEIGAWVA